MKLFTLTSLMCLALTSACQKSSAPASNTPASGTSAPPAADKIAWDDPSKSPELDWPMAGAAAMPTVAASAFGRGAAPGDGVTAIWKRLSSYSGSFLRTWRSALESADAPPPTDVVDAFNELALAVTGPTGFWRKTVPSRWLGCDELADSAPCKKVQGVNKELEQWDAIQKQIDALSPERAAQFLDRNEARIMLYLDTYVPTEPSAEAMKVTTFYKSHLAEVFDTMGTAGGTTNGNDL